MLQSRKGIENNNGEETKRLIQKSISLKQTKNNQNIYIFD